jgi:hypothetical protein
MATGDNLSTSECIHRMCEGKAVILTGSPRSVAGAGIMMKTRGVAASTQFIKLIKGLSMRSTKASAAVARLNARDSENRYSMGMTASGFFYLLRISGSGPQERISGDLPLEEFVQFANRTGPQQKAKISKHDAAFEKQLGNRNKGEG